MTTSRRLFLQKASAYTVAAAGKWRAEARTAPSGFFAKRGLPMGIQLFTLDPLLSQDLEGGLRAVAKAGYNMVETGNFYGRSAKDFKAALDRVGLRCTSIGASAQPGGGPNEPTLMDRTKEVIANARAVGATTVMMPAPLQPLGRKPRPGVTGGEAMLDLFEALTEDDYRRTADFLNSRARELKAAGITLTYHNHYFEFINLPNGSAGYDILLAQTDPELVHFELDIGWAQAASIDPLVLLAKHKGRFRQMHVKDSAGMLKAFGRVLPRFVAIGLGVARLREILPAAYDAGVRQFFVERDPPPEKIDLVPDIERSARYLASLVA